MRPFASGLTLTLSVERPLQLGANVGSGSSPSLRALKKQSSARHATPRPGSATAVPHTADVHDGACDEARRLLGSRQRECAHEGRPTGHAAQLPLRLTEQRTAEGRVATCPPLTRRPQNRRCLPSGKCLQRAIFTCGVSLANRATRSAPHPISVAADRVSLTPSRWSPQHPHCFGPSGRCR